MILYYLYYPTRFESGRLPSIWIGPLSLTEATAKYKSSTEPVKLIEVKTTHTTLASKE